MRNRGPLIWDLPSRLFHWGLVICLAGSWITAEAGFEWTEWHFYLGYTSLALITFRIIWGLAGTHHARFVNFLTSPAKALGSLGQLFSRTPTGYTGHTPIGGWSVLLMLALIAIQAGTGLFLTDDIVYAGPYNSVVTNDTAGQLARIHHLNFTALQIVVTLHIAAVLWYRWGKGINLVLPMLTGRKPEADPGAAIASSRPVRALVILIIAAGAITALVQLAPAPPADIYSF